MDAKHTPTPWAISPVEEYEGTAYIPIMAGDTIVATVSEGRNGLGEQEQADAEFIVRACNSFADLLTLARQLRQTAEHYAALDEKAGDDEGARMKRLTMLMVDDVIARAEGR